MIFKMSNIISSHHETGHITWQPNQDLQQNYPHHRLAVSHQGLHRHSLQAHRENVLFTSQLDCDRACVYSWYWTRLYGICPPLSLVRGSILLKIFSGSLTVKACHLRSSLPLAGDNQVNHRRFQFWIPANIRSFIHRANSEHQELETNWIH